VGLLAPILWNGGLGTAAKDIRVKTYLTILPAPQREFWDRHAAGVPQHFVLYGGTAVALRYGHRGSADFDFFSARALDEGAIRRALPILKTAQVLQQDPATFIVAVPMSNDEVKISFFGGMTFGRVGDPEKLAPEKPALASSLDLLATKIKVIHQRVEVKDYQDIEALLRGGLSLNQGIAAARTLYGDAVNPLMAAKAVAWFKDGGLESALSQSTRRFLEKASATFDPVSALTPLPLRSKELNARQRAIRTTSN
jgi:hypothetical protein